MTERNLAVVQTQEVDLNTESRVKMIRDKFANGAPPNEFALFIEVCRTLNLDPLRRQVYLIPRQDNKNNRTSWTIQTSIDGYRAIADRTGAYAGSDDPTYTESNGTVWGNKPRPETATVTVWKMVQGQRCPFTATARWDEYVQEKSPMWNKMPHTMLAKCAESLALRKAFPEQLSGLYTDSEMDQAGPPQTPTTTVTADAQVIDIDTGEVLNDRPAITSWTEFWKWARENGFNEKQTIESFIGRPMQGLSVQEVVDLIQAGIDEAEESAADYEEMGE